MSDDLFALSQFNGTAHLFPLPNLVLFPSVIQPLHIFEPRYRQMTADALAGDRLLALVLLKPGWEADYEGRPRLHSIVCLGRIIADQQLEDGRFNLLIRGLSRARVLEEVPNGKLYRSARLELLTDAGQPAAGTAKELRRQMTRAALRWVATQGQVIDQFRKLLKTELLLGTLCDIFSFALALDTEFKQRLLEILDVEQRVRRLLTYLKVHEPRLPRLPPIISFRLISATTESALAALSTGLTFRVLLIS